MPLIRQSRIYRADLQANPKVLYIFGDNEERFGLGGQAGEMRGEPNAHGIATLVAPALYWNDTGDERQCRVLDSDFGLVFEALKAGRTVVFPLDGIGTGIAALEKKAPVTFAYLLSLVEEMQEFT